MRRLTDFHGVIEEVGDPDLRELRNRTAGWRQLLCSLRNCSERCSNWAGAGSGGSPPGGGSCRPAALCFAATAAALCGILAAGAFLLDRSSYPVIRLRIDFLFSARGIFDFSRSEFPVATARDDAGIPQLHPPPDTCGIFCFASSDVDLLRCL
jgi:hypothetical protein